MARIPVHLQCNIPGCKRLAQTDRPAYKGRCRRCYLDSIGGYELKTVPNNAPRCPHCDVLLDAVDHDGQICTMKRCQEEEAKEVELAG